MKTTTKTDLLSSNVEIQLVINNLKTQNQIQMVIGPSGTGKSSMVRNLDTLTGMRCLKVAPTHQAARNINGDSINTFFEFSSRVIEKNVYNVKQFPTDSPKHKCITEADIIAIDNISMVNSTQLDAIDFSLRRNTGNNWPFGGKKVLLTGDPLQLQPITSRKDKKRLNELSIHSFLFIDSEVLKEKKPVVTQLKKNLIYPNIHYSQFLEKVRQGSAITEDINSINIRHASSDILETLTNVITICSSNEKVENINREQLDKLPGTLSSIKAEVTGDFPFYMAPYPFDLELKPQSRIIFENNDSELRWNQGDLGTVTSINQECIEIQIDGKQLVQLKPETFNHINHEMDLSTGQWVEQIKGTFKQYPIRLGWAITIHGCQGMFFDKAIIDFGDKIYGAGLAYSALSRVTDWGGMFLRRPLKLDDIRCDYRLQMYFS